MLAIGDTGLPRLPTFTEYLNDLTREEENERTVERGNSWLRSTAFCEISQGP